MFNLTKTSIALATALTLGLGSIATLADDDKSVVLVQFQLEAAGTTGADLTAFFDKILPSTEAYEGNQTAEYFVASNNPSKILLLEQWDSKEDFDAYLNWRIEEGDFATLRSLLASDPVVTFFEG